MRLFRGLTEVPAGYGPSAVAIGKFDGVHAGHRQVLAELARLAAEAPDAPQPVALTFDRHPLALLAPERCPTALTSVEQKLELLAQTGLSATLLVKFDAEFAALSAPEFVEQYLVDGLGTRLVLVGADFRFGAGGRGEVGLLRSLGERHGFRVAVIPDVMLGTVRASSTRVRQLLGAGDVSAAAEVLGHVPTMRGMVVHGAKRGRELGYPTANLEPEAQGFEPAEGVYAGWLIDAGTRYPAAISVGKNPTFEGIERIQVEAHVLGRNDLDLYDHVVDVQFLQHIRPQVAFAGVDALVAQIADDVASARRILGQAE